MPALLRRSLAGMAQAFSKACVRQANGMHVIDPLAFQHALANEYTFAQPVHPVFSQRDGQ